MAEDCVKTDNIGQASGSEFVFDFYCEVCRDDGLNNEAHGYCVDCAEYLCGTCIQAHKKARPSRRHDVLDQASMLKDNPLPQLRVSKDIATYCNIHSSKLVEFYCTSHDTLGCSTCFAAVHKNCAEIESIHDKTENILDSKDYNDFTRSLQNMVRKSRNMITRTNENVTKSERCCSSVMSQIKRLRNKFNAIFDELEQNLTAQVEAIASEDKCNMERMKEELETLAEAVDKIRSQCEDLANAKRAGQLYIEMKKRKREMVSLKKSLTKAEENNDVRELEFEPNNNLRDSFRSNGLGKIVITNALSANTRAVHVSNMDVRTSTDNYKPYITGTCVMSSTKVIVADFNSSGMKVKLLDTITRKVVSDLRLSDYAFDIVRISETQVAVSLQNKWKIVLVNVADTLSVEREISVQGRCRGMAYSQNKLLVVLSDSPRLEILDLHGNLIKKIEKDGDGNKLLSSQSYVCVSANGEIIYVSDSGAKRVVCFTFDGVVKSVYTGLSDPQKICVDNYGHFFVAGGKERTVHMVSRDCTKSKAILTQADRLNNDVLSVSLCHDTNRLYVGMGNNLAVKVYQLSSEAGDDAVQCRNTSTYV